MDFSELSHQTEIRDSLDKILSEHCSQERLKKYDANFKHDEDSESRAGKSPCNQYFRLSGPN